MLERNRVFTKMMTKQISLLFYLTLITPGRGMNSIGIGSEIRLLNQIDNAQVVQTLLISVNKVLDNYINDQTSIKSSKARAIILKEIPSDEMLKELFATHFKIIKYDRTYSNYIKKDFDYTAYNTLEEENTWEKFVFACIQDDYFLVLLSYTMEDVVPTVSKGIENFFGHVLIRMFDKLSNPIKSIYRPELRLIQSEPGALYYFVYHNSIDGYITKQVPTYSDGLREQIETDSQKLSSCILMIENGENSLHSIHHPIIPGYIIPDFYAHLKIETKTEFSTNIHDDDL